MFPDHKRSYSEYGALLIELTSPKIDRGQSSGENHAASLTLAIRSLHSRAWRIVQSSDDSVISGSLWSFVGVAASVISLLHCSPMATEIPQRELRNNTAGLLRRVEAGEQLRITVHGHPVADLVPVDRARQFVPFNELVNELAGKILPDDRLDDELRELDETPRDPFA
jgi:prevent-host-death family protein